MAASLINQASESDPLTPAEDIMVALFEWLFDISLAVAGAAATGSIFLILVEVAKVGLRRFIQRRATGRSMQMQRVDQV
ncbi:MULTISPECIES: hypothetical protein [Paraburkholderia]|nr:hypothetical protein [Paraburkholderia phenazinium]